MTMNVLTTLWRKIETFFIVTFVTCLVWVYAEGESARTGRVTATLQFVSSAGQTLAIEPAERVVELQYRCSTSEEQRLRELVRRPLGIEIRSDQQAESVKSVSLRDRILTDTAIGQMGVQIVSVDPEAVELRVRELEKVSLPIVASPGKLRLAGPATVEPGQGTVLAPKSLAPLLEGARLTVRLDQTNQPIEPGKEYKFKLPIEPPDVLTGSGVMIEPARAEATFSVVSSSQTYTLEHVRIMMVVPPRLFTRYDVVLKDDLLVLSEPVEVVGPSDKIEQLRAGPDRVVALLRLSAEDLAKGITSSQVELTLPEGVTTRLPAPRLNFEIVPRKAEGGTTGGVGG
ncbi:MAG: hypothetical protein IT441_05340 [Phycisphaeraceae bacterium]|nr:hypothetical protein [Phycisphaeraceae bacterium]